MELVLDAPSTSMGLYNAGSPAPLFQVFPVAASAAWFATCYLGPGESPTVQLYDQNGVAHVDPARTATWGHLKRLYR